MCEIDWEIVQKYIDTLIWPAMVLGLFLLFRKQITKLVDRITYDSEHIEIGGFLKAQLTHLASIKETTQKGGQPTPEQTKQLISTTVLLQIESIKKLGEEYTHSKYDRRRIIKNRIKDYSIGLTIDDLLPLFSSTKRGHRIAAAMALEETIYKNKIDPFDNKEVKNFIVKSLSDSSSFLRYETLQIVFQSQRLMNELKDKLNAMKETDENAAIRNILRLYLK